MPRSEPKTSSSRAALAAAGALLDLCEAATAGYRDEAPLTPDQCVNLSCVIVANVKTLQPYQLGELTSFLAERLGVFDQTEDGPSEVDPPVRSISRGDVTIELDPRQEDAGDPAKDARQQAAVDELVENGQQSIEKLAERVHGPDA